MNKVKRRGEILDSRGGGGYGIRRTGEIAILIRPLTGLTYYGSKGKKRQNAAIHVPCTEGE